MADRATRMTPEGGHRCQSIPKKVRRKTRFAEVAGGTAAECAAVACCCPCALASLVVLATVRLPAGLCRRALGRKKRGITGKKRPSLLHERKRDDSAPPQVHPAPSESESDDECPDVPKAADDGWRMDDEIWGKLYTGFWRSPSERE
ncbi:unnamed protein product [Victoria cruziana]